MAVEVNSGGGGGNVLIGFLLGAVLVAIAIVGFARHLETGWNVDREAKAGVVIPVPVLGQGRGGKQNEDAGQESAHGHDSACAACRPQASA